MTPHPDDLTLLLHVRGTLDDVGRARIRRRSDSCEACREALDELTVIDARLREIAPSLGLASDNDMVFSERDPFRARPRHARGASPRFPGPPERTVEVARSAEGIAPALVEAAVRGSAELRSALAALRLSRAEERLGVVYALDDAMERMVERPARWLVFGEEVGARARQARATAGRSATEADSLCSLDEVEGVARLVVGAACNWSGDLSRGGRALAGAFRVFGRLRGLEPRLAQVEMVEAQRRSFIGRPAEGLRLAGRAEATFSDLGLVALATRARTARALALSYLEREEEALAEFRCAQGEFERLGVWGGWVSALNGAGYSLLKLGRLDDARREYARALRRVSRTEHPAVHAFVRANLAKTLLAAGRTADAARGFASAAALFLGQGAVVDGLVAMLGEVEARARGGDAGGAGRTLHRVRTTLEAQGDGGAPLLRSLEALLAADRLDLELLERFVRETAAGIRESPLERRGAV